MYYTKVMNLCSKRVTRDHMGHVSRIIDIYGYTPADLMQMDYASIIAIEERLDQITAAHEAEMAAKTNRLAELKSGKE